MLALSVSSQLYNFFGYLMDHFTSASSQSKKLLKLFNFASSHEAVCVTESVSLRESGLSDVS